MVEMRVTDQGYYVNWGPEDLGGREAVLLVLRAFRVYAQPAQGGAVRAFPAYRTKGLHLRGYDAILPDGMYEYYLADREDLERPLTDEMGRIFFGQKQPISVELVPVKGGIVRLSIFSPLPFAAGECGLDYGLSKPVPLPGTRAEGTSHVVRCLLAPVRPELPVRLWYSPELSEVVQTQEFCLNDGSL